LFYQKHLEKHHRYLDNSSITLKNKKKIISKPEINLKQKIFSSPSLFFRHFQGKKFIFVENSKIEGT
jgi:hypothetical protein